TFNFIGLQSQTQVLEFQPQDISAANTSQLQLTSLTQTSDYVTNGRFSLTYYIVKYPQLIDMNGNASKYFNFPAGSNRIAHVHFVGAATSSLRVAISDIAQIKL